MIKTGLSCLKHNLWLNKVINLGFVKSLTLLHSEMPKLHTILAFLSAIGLSNSNFRKYVKSFCTAEAPIFSLPV